MIDTSDFIQVNTSDDAEKLNLHNAKMQNKHQPENYLYIAYFGGLTFVGISNFQL